MGIAAAPAAAAADMVTPVLMKIAVWIAEAGGKKIIQSDSSATDVMHRPPITRRSLPILAQQSFSVAAILVHPLLTTSRGSVSWVVLMQVTTRGYFQAVRRE